MNAAKCARHSDEQDHLRIEQLKDFTRRLMDGADNRLSLIAQFTHRIADHKSHATIKT